MPVLNLMDRARAAAEERPDPQGPAQEEEPGWYLMESPTIDDRFVYLRDKKLLKEVRERFPGVAVYSRLELIELLVLKDEMPDEEWKDLFRSVHNVKKHLKAWMVPGLPRGKER